MRSFRHLSLHLLQYVKLKVLRLCSSCRINRYVNATVDQTRLGLELLILCSIRCRLIYNSRVYAIYRSVAWIAFRVLSVQTHAMHTQDLPSLLSLRSRLIWVPVADGVGCLCAMQITSLLKRRMMVTTHGIRISWICDCETQFYTTTFNKAFLNMLLSIHDFIEIAHSKNFVQLWNFKDP